MLKANLKIISALKDYLFSISSKPEFRNNFCSSTTDFTRKRKLSFDNMILFIVRLCKKSLSVEIEMFFEEMKSNITCSISAFCEKRKKLSPVFFIAWNSVLFTNFYSEYKNKVKRWKSFRLIAVDGSSISLPNYDRLRSFFGGQSNATNFSVIAKTFYCFDVLNKMILFPLIAPYRYGEFRMACDIINSGILQKDMLLIFDRFYSHYKIAALLEFNELAIKYVIRVNDNLSLYSNFIKSRKRSTVINLMPSLTSIRSLKECGYIVTKQTPVKTRLVRVTLPGGRVEVLMTNLWTDEGFSDNEFKDLYAKRWGVESNIDFQKNILQLESVSGLSPIAVQQDFYATIFISNLHFLLVKESQEILDTEMSHRKYPMQVNNNKAFGKLKKNIVQIFINEKPIEVLKELSCYFLKDPLPVRKNRHFPRLRKSKQANSKHRTFTNYKSAF